MSTIRPSVTAAILWLCASILAVYIIVGSLHQRQNVTTPGLRAPNLRRGPTSQRQNVVGVTPPELRTPNLRRGPTSQRIPPAANPDAESKSIRRRTFLASESTFVAHDFSTDSESPDSYPAPNTLVAPAPNVLVAEAAIFLVYLYIYILFQLLVAGLTHSRRRPRHRPRRRTATSLATSFLSSVSPEFARDLTELLELCVSRDTSVQYFQAVLQMPVNRAAATAQLRASERTYSSAWIYVRRMRGTSNYTAATSYYIAKAAIVNSQRDAGAFRERIAIFSQFQGHLTRLSYMPEEAIVAVMQRCLQSSPNTTNPISLVQMQHLQAIAKSLMDLQAPPADDDLQANGPPPADDDLQANGPPPADDDTCVICFEHVIPSDFCELPCEHHFHHDCMAELVFHTGLQGQRDIPCPLCRQSC